MRKKMAILFFAFYSSQLESETIPRAFLELSTESGEMAVAVVDNNGENGSRTINFSCSNKCTVPSWSEDINDEPLGIFRLSDDVDNVITTWSSGSAYDVRIYHIGKIVSKVLDVSSITAPTMTIDKDGRQKVIVAKYQQGRLNTYSVSFVWNDHGNHFDEIK
jgi:hypothetical protein